MRFSEAQGVAVVGTLDFAETVRWRHSVRAFLPLPLPSAQLEAVLEDAQRFPSNANTQPWVVHIVSGAKRAEISRELLCAARQHRVSLDFSYDPRRGDNEVLLRHVHEQGHRYYEVMGIKRDDYDARGKLHLRNFEFFGAPTLCFCSCPRSVTACGWLQMSACTAPQPRRAPATSRGAASCAENRTASLGPAWRYRHRTGGSKTNGCAPGCGQPIPLTYGRSPTRRTTSCPPTHWKTSSPPTPVWGTADRLLHIRALRFAAGGAKPSSRAAQRPARGRSSTKPAVQS
jgi:nitroreductase